MTAAHTFSSVLTACWNRLTGKKINQREQLDVGCGDTPREIAYEREALQLKARIFSSLLSRRIEACRRELWPELSESRCSIIPLPELNNSMKHEETVTKKKPESV